MKKIKSITLSVAELSEILAISDPAIREAALKALKQATDDPANIDLDAYLDGPGIVLTIVHKIYRRYETARLRAENKAKKQKEATKTATSKAAVPKEAVTMKINEGTVRRLLWLKHNLPQALDALKRLVAPMKGTDMVSGTIAEAVNQIEKFVADRLRLLIKFAETYFRIPRNMRPDEFELPVA